MKHLLLALLLLPAAAPSFAPVGTGASEGRQEDAFPVAADGSEAYRASMKAGIGLLERKRHADAAREFLAALREKPGDKGAERGFGRAVREMEIYNTRFGELKQAALRKYGMQDAVPAIERGLAWLVGEQHGNGRWSCRPTEATSDAATTSFALLAFMADGNSETVGPHRDTVRKGIDWLLARQRDDGSFGGPRLYTEGLCALALTEAFVLGGRERTFEAAQKAINYIVASQRPEGGWMYLPSDAGWGDTSVTGMMFQPLKQGQMAMLDFDLKCLERGRKFVDRLTDREHWVGYRSGDERHSPALTAIGNLIRLYSGQGADDPEVREGVGIVESNREQMRGNLYFLYYGAMLSFLAQGHAWTSWREVMLPHLLSKQLKEGENAGAWMPEGWDLPSGFANYLSPVDSTAMSLLSLECCYRYVPAKMLKE